MKEIKEKLDKIIELLEFYNSISKARMEMVTAHYIDDPFMPMGCNCKDKDKTSAVVICPVHG